MWVTAVTRVAAARPQHFRPLHAAAAVTCAPGNPATAVATKSEQTGSGQREASSLASGAQFARIATDSYFSTGAGDESAHGQKLFVLPHLPAVLAGRGSTDLLLGDRLSVVHPGACPAYNSLPWGVSAAPAEDNGGASAGLGCVYCRNF